MPESFSHANTSICIYSLSSHVAPDETLAFNLSEFQNMRRLTHNSEYQVSHVALKYIILAWIP